MPTDVVEMEGAFGEFPGYMAQRDYSFFMELTAITMRTQADLSLDPEPDAAEREQQDAQYRARGGGLRLLRAAGMDNVIEVEYLECAGSNAVAVVKLKKRDADDGKKALRLLAEKFMGKMLVAVDEDIDVRDAENVLWAIAYRAQPYKRHGGGGSAAVHARSGGGPARRVTRARHARQAAALDRAAHRRHACPGPTRRCRCPSASSWSMRSRSGRACSCRRSISKRRGGAIHSAIGPRRRSRRPSLAVQGRHYETGEKQKQSRRRFGE